MKCQDLELVVIDLVRPTPAPGDASGEALAHAESCERCAVRLADERALLADLRALAARTVDSGPSAKAEAGALAAFRALEPAAEVVPLVRHRPIHIWIPAAAAAAVVCAFASAVAYRSARTPKGSDVVPPPAKLIASVPTHVEPTVPSPSEPPNIRFPVTTSGSHEVASGNRFHRARTSVPSGANRDDVRREIVTDYYPLVGASDLTPTDGGQIVRLELPRSALAPFGFQINAERSDRPITADVLLGNDGVARAIRFVQPSSSDARR